MFHHPAADRSWLSALVLLVSTLTASNGCSSDPIIYQVTIRDFLPIWCMSLAEFQALGINDGTEIHGGRLTDFTFAGSAGPRCPYPSYIASGEISGHPDFNRPATPGWYMDFLFDLEDTYGVNTLINGTCDLNDVGNITRRPPALAVDETTGDRGPCQARLFAYTQRMNVTMDIASSGLPKPQYCTSDPNGRCGYFIDSRKGPVIQTHQSANKYFQDMWYNDNKKYNKRVGSTIVLREQAPCNGVFRFDSETDNENNETSSPGIYAPHGTASLILNESEHPDPFEAKVWPEFDNKNFPIKSEDKFLHTSEIHTFFEYRGDEAFTFSGDDDVWVYVNGILAIELGGLHSRADQLIDLGHPAAQDMLGIEVGNIYTFDLYQAERQPPGSNFKVTTTLAEACNVLTSKKVFFPDPDGNTLVKSRAVDFTFVDGSVYAGESIKLLPPGSVDLSSFIFVREEINVGTGFIVDFKFTANGLAEGFAFVLHQRPEGLSNFPISSGPGLGFKGSTHSVAVAFDFCTDRDAGTCNEQDVNIYYPDDGSKPNKPSLSNRRVYDPIMRSLQYGDEHKVRIAYFFRPPALEVTIDDSLYLREMPFDPLSSLESVAAFAGFTATASTEPGDITIYDWRMESVDVDSTVTVTSDFVTGQNVSEMKSVLGDNIESGGWSLQTRDLCLFDIEFGNRAQNAGGKYVEELDPVTGTYAGNRTSPLIVDAIVVDTEDGKYAYNLKVRDEGVFSLYLFYGDRSKTCTFDVVVAGAGYNVANGPSTDGCFYASALYAVRVLPLTSAPTAQPTTNTLAPVDDSITVIAGGIGGVVGLLAFIACLFAVAYRRKWLREKGYIEMGVRYNLDSKTTFKPDTKETRVGRDLMASRQAILLERARVEPTTLSATLGDLETEQEELSEQIRVLKTDLARKARQKQSSETMMEGLL